MMDTQQIILTILTGIAFLHLTPRFFVVNEKIAKKIKEWILNILILATRLIFLIGFGMFIYNSSPEDDRLYWLCFFIFIYTLLLAHDMIYLKKDYIKKLYSK